MCFVAQIAQILFEGSAQATLRLSPITYCPPCCDHLKLKTISRRAIVVIKVPYTSNYVRLYVLAYLLKLNPAKVVYIDKHLC